MSELAPPDDPAALLAGAVEAEDWSSVQAAVGAHWSWLIINSPDVLRSALQALPDRIHAQRPRYVAALRYLEHLPVGDEPRPYRYRHTPFPENPATLLDVLVEFTSRAAALRSAGRHAAAADEVEAARKALENADPQEADDLHAALPHLHAQWGRVREFAGEWSLALIEYQDAFDLAVVNGDVLVQYMAAGSLAWLHAIAGHEADAQKWLAVVPRADLGRAAERYRAPALLARVLLTTDRLEWAGADEVFASLDLSVESEYWAPYLYLKARLQVDADRWALISELDVAIVNRPASLSSTGVNALFLALARAELYLGLALPGQALRALDAVPREQESSPYVELARARAELMAGNVAAVARGSAALVDHASATPRILTEALILSAVASSRLDRAADSASYARRAMSLIRGQNLAQALTIVPRVDVDTLASQTDLGESDLLARVHRHGRFPTTLVTADLSQRERAVLGELVSGATVAEIAERLFVSPNTVKSQLRSSYRKLGARNRSEAEAIVRRAGLFG